MRISIMMTNFTLSKGITDRSDFRLWKLFIDISPKSLYTDFNLCDSEHSIFECISFSLSHIDLKILDIRGKIKLSMNPIRMSYGIYIFQQFWIFIRLERDSFFENISFSLLDSFLSIENIGLCNMMKSSFHKLFFYKILDFFYMRNKF